MAIPLAGRRRNAQVDAVEKASREGALDHDLKGHLGKALLEQLRGKCVKCDQPPVLHVTDLNSGTGEVTCFDLCEEHAGDYRNNLPPQTHRT